MIKVMCKENNTAIKIKVVGTPLQWCVSFGTHGEYTVKRGRSAGQKKSGIKWDKTFYPNTLEQALLETTKRLSEVWGIPAENQKIEGIEGWKFAIEEEKKMISICKEIGNAFHKLIDDHGEALKQFAIKDGEVIEESDDVDSVDTVDSEETKTI